MESSQIEVSSSSTVEQLYAESRVRILRLYLFTKMRKEKQSSEESTFEKQLTSIPTVDLTGGDPPLSDEVQEIYETVSQHDDSEIIVQSVEMFVNDDVDLDDTVPWENQPPQTPR